MIEVETMPLIKTKSATVHLNQTEDTVIVTATASYIPMEEFKNLFNELGDYVKSHKIKKLVFDKSNLRTFHQPSMVWYHVSWKSEMAKFGLRSYRKILPNDDFFKQSVKVGRARIKEAHPEFNFDDYDIQYVDTVEEALSK